jgi:hypothetical protein
VQPICSYIYSGASSARALGLLGDLAALHFPWLAKITAATTDSEFKGPVAGMAGTPSPLSCP